MNLPTYELRRDVVAKEIGTLNLSVHPDALRIAIESGRLLELADTVAREAALQIASQLVQHVADAALKPELLKSGATASVSYVFEEGDFGTVPPRPHFGVVNLEGLAGTLRSPLTRVAASSSSPRE
jgi:hypothetical protein